MACYNLGFTAEDVCRSRQKLMAAPAFKEFKAKFESLCTQSFERLVARLDQVIRSPVVVVFVYELLCAEISVWNVGSIVDWTVRVLADKTSLLNKN